MYEAVSTFSTLEGVSIDEADASRQETSSIDQIPIIGRLPGIENMLFATGWSGHGFAASFILGFGHLISSIAMVAVFFYVKEYFNLTRVDESITILGGVQIGGPVSLVAGVMLIALGIREYVHGHSHDHNHGMKFSFDASVALFFIIKKRYDITLI